MKYSGKMLHINLPLHKDPPPPMITRQRDCYWYINNEYIDYYLCEDLKTRDPVG